MRLKETSSETWPPPANELVRLCLARDICLHLPYSLIEADAVFHNVSIDVVIRRYIAAKLREVSDAT